MLIYGQKSIKAEPVTHGVQRITVRDAVEFDDFFEHEVPDITGTAKVINTLGLSENHDVYAISPTAHAVTWAHEYLTEQPLSVLRAMIVDLSDLSRLKAALEQAVDVPSALAVIDDALPAPPKEPLWRRHEGLTRLRCFCDADEFDRLCRDLLRRTASGWWVADRASGSPRPRRFDVAGLAPYWRVVGEHRDGVWHVVQITADDRRYLVEPREQDMTLLVFADEHAQRGIRERLAELAGSQDSRNPGEETPRFNYRLGLPPLRWSSCRLAAIGADVRVLSIPDDAELVAPQFPIADIEEVTGGTGAAFADVPLLSHAGRAETNPALWHSVRCHALGRKFLHSGLTPQRHRAAGRRQSFRLFVPVNAYAPPVTHSTAG